MINQKPNLVTIDTSNRLNNNKVKEQLLNRIEQLEKENQKLKESLVLHKNQGKGIIITKEVERKTFKEKQEMKPV